MTDNPGTIGLDILTDAPYGAYAVNLAQVIRFWNRSAELITGHMAEDVIGRPCYEVVQNLTGGGATPACQHGCPSLRALQEGRLPQTYEVSMLCASGERKSVSITPLVILGILSSETVLVHLFDESGGNSGAEQAGRTMEPPLGAPGDGHEPIPEIREQLTEREHDVLRFTALGLTPQEIARELRISYHTVRNYTAAVRRKLGARNKPNMVRIAHYLKLL